MGIIFLYPPKSLSELNSCLQKCIETKTHMPLIALIGCEDQYTQIPFELFCQVVYYPLRSYPDCKQDNLAQFKTYTVELFPVSSNLEIWKIFNRCLRELKGEEVPRTPLEDTAKSLGTFFQDFQPLDEESLKIQTPASERLTALLTEDLNVQQKAERLQLILSLLHYEWNFIRTTLEEVRATLSSDKNYAKYVEGADQKIRLSREEEIVFFPCPEVFESPEAFAFFIQFRKILQECTALIEKIDFFDLSTAHPFQVIYSKLKRFSDEIPLEGNQSVQLRDMVDKIFAFLASQLSSSQALQNSRKLVGTGINQYSSLSSKVHSFEESTAPYVEALLSLTVRKVGKLLGSGIPREEERDKEYYSQREHICQGYAEYFEQQNGLYIKARCALETLLQAQKNKKDFLRFRSNLDPFEQGTLFPERLTPVVLSDFNPFGIIERLLQKQIDLTEVQKSFLPKIPPVPFAAHRKKKKKKNSPQSFSVRRQEIAEPMTSIKESIPSFFSYEKRVIRWLRSSDSFSEAVFPEYNILDLLGMRKMKAYHGFSLEVDAFYEMGTTRPWKNAKTGKEDIQYILPARITFEGEEISGTITYCVGEDGKCYHRFFHPMKASDLAQALIGNVFKDADFPPLGVDPSPVFDQFLKTEGDTVSIHPILGIVTIIDQTNGSTIRLFPVESQF